MYIDTRDDADTICSKVGMMPAAVQRFPSQVAQIELRYLPND